MLFYFTSGEPLIFIEVALLKNVAQTIQVSFLWVSHKLRQCISLLSMKHFSTFHRKFCGIVLQYLKVRQHVHCSIPFHQLRYDICYTEQRTLKYRRNYTVYYHGHGDAYLDHCNWNGSCAWILGLFISLICIAVMTFFFVFITFLVILQFILLFVPNICLFFYLYCIVIPPSVSPASPDSREKRSIGDSLPKIDNLLMYTWMENSEILQPGLQGINLGKFLIKRVITLVKRDMPHISVSILPTSWGWVWRLWKIAVSCFIDFVST